MHISDISLWLNSLLPQIQNLGLLGYFIIFAIFFGEALVGIGLIVPGAIIAFIIGTLAAKGIFSLQELMLFGSLGFFIGDLLSFTLGRKGSGLFKANARFLKLAHLEKGQEFFNKHGNKSVLIGRYIGFVRPLTPFIAGVAKMNWLRFIILNTISIVSWLAIHILAGFFFGQALWLIKLWSSRLEVMLIYIASFVAIFYLSKRLIIKNGKELYIIISAIWQSFKQSLKQNHDLQKFIGRHDYFFNFLNERFDKAKFTGKKLTYLVLIFILLFYNFLSLTDSIFNQGEILAMDLSLENLMRTFKNFLFIKILLGATTIASWQIVIALSILFSLAYYIRGREKSLFGYWVAVLGAFISSAFLKTIIERPRPLDSFYNESSYSFPSTHSAVAVAMFGYITYLYCRKHSFKKRVNAIFLSSLLIGLVGFSRLYLRVHFLSDVMAGYLLGAMWLTVGIGINQYFWFQHKTLIFKRHFSTGLKLVSLILIFLTITLYSGFLGYYSSRINFKKLEPVPVITTNNIVDSLHEYKLSSYSESFDGDQQEPISLIIAANNKDELASAFTEIGWQKADKPNFKALVKALRNGLMVKQYDNLPIAPSFWETKVNDLAFTHKSADERNYVKFWETNFRTPNNKIIFVGIAAAKRPTRLIIKKSLNPNIDGEREFIFEKLKEYKKIASWSRVQFNQPTIVKKLLDEYFTDGKLYIIDLK
ncbi:MAG: LssY C-terminal domain-containing protein [bacterium]